MMDTCIAGDVRDVLPTLADESVQMCVTSPPYWGLRDYGTGTWEGGDDGCVHSVGGQVQDNKAPGAIVTGQRPGVDASLCRKCGARRIDAQIGLEPTPEEYVATMVDVFREVRRVLADDGVLWLNLGDCYNSTNGFHRGEAYMDGGNPRVSRYPDRSGCGLKPKDLVGIPWRVAFALQADGWYLRQDIIWHKPNPMPEGVTDRCTKAHEYLFLLTKAPRYYYDAGAIAEPAIAKPQNRFSDYSRVVPGFPEQRGLHPKGQPPEDAGRNRRSVWTVATAPYADAHFATFPPALVEPCILAGSRPGDVVLDPFMGSGTTAQVAQALNRRWLGVELNPDYHDMQARRTAQAALPFA